MEKNLNVRLREIVDNGVAVNAKLRNYVDRYKEWQQRFKLKSHVITRKELLEANIREREQAKEETL